MYGIAKFHFDEIHFYFQFFFCFIVFALDFAGVSVGADWVLRFSMST